MIIDQKLHELPLQGHQLFFISCWHNMVHLRSLDSNRVRAINAKNGLKELLGMMKPPADFKDFSKVAAEVQEILNNDPVILHPTFNSARNELVLLLKQSADQKVYEKNKNLIGYFASELFQKASVNYVNFSLDALKKILIDDGLDNAGQSQCLPEVQAVTGNLLSALLDSGSSLESLYHLYKGVLSRKNSDGEYDFQRQFEKLNDIIRTQEKTFNVTFAVRSVSNPSAFPPEMGPIKFSASIEAPPNVAINVQNFFSKEGRTIYATISVSAKDVRAAGTEAYKKINNLMDLVRFEYERGAAKVSEEFIAIPDGEPEPKYILLEIPKIVPNPAKSVKNSELEGFIKSINELVIESKFAQNGGDRIQSAFRLYRVGSDTNIFENKLVNWWTAIEYLVKGQYQGGGIGDVVEENLIPTLCLSYLKKLLNSFASTLVSLKVNLLDESGAEIRLKELAALDVYRLFTTPHIKGQLATSVADPYISYRLNEFLNKISTLEKTLEMINRHEQRLRWHIQRLYRARCDIVHSANQIVNAALLCANLEFYLKTMLRALLESLASTPHINSAKEFFDRQAHSYARVKEELQSNKSERLLATLI